jgi:hypothetical protein
MPAEPTPIDLFRYRPRRDRDARRERATPKRDPLSPVRPSEPPAPDDPPTAA